MITLPVNWISITILAVTLLGTAAVMLAKRWNKIVVGFVGLSAGVVALIVYALVEGR